MRPARADEQVRRNARVETRIRAGAGIGGRYPFVTACVRKELSAGRLVGGSFGGRAEECHATTARFCDSSNSSLWTAGGRVIATSGTR